MSEENTSPAVPEVVARADRLAATAFFNALLREIDDWQLTAGEALVALDGRGECRLRITLLHRSLAGRCRLALPLRLEDNGECREIAFIDAVARLLDAPALSRHPLIGELDGERRAAFLASVTGSRDNIAASLAERDDLERLTRGPAGFLMAEQGLLVGHEFHPAPKSRAPFSAAQARAFTPEHRARFRLQWWAIAPERVVGASSREASAAALMHDLLPAALATALPADYCALPLHPWQAGFLAECDEVRALLDAGELHILGEAPEEDGCWWYPTTSHRSLWSPDTDWMVKGSLSARLTNSVRVLHADEVMRGLRLDRWWPQVAADIRHRFRLLQEPAWLGWKNDAGEIEEASLALLRENPIDDGEAPLAVLATLTQPLGQRLDEDGETLLSASVRRLAERERLTPSRAATGWFDDYCTAVLAPLIRLVVEEGIVLLAHQQNIVLRLDGERPVGVVYRDCQGSGVTRHFFTRQPDETVSDDHRITHDMLMRYFPYYVILNATMAVSAALAEAGLADERELMARLRRFLEGLRAQVRDTGDPALLDHLLQAPHLAAKGNFFCYLAGINESTLDDPSRIYLSVPNPIRVGLPA